MMRIGWRRRRPLVGPTRLELDEALQARQRALDALRSAQARDSRIDQVARSLQTVPATRNNFRFSGVRPRPL